MKIELNMLMLCVENVNFYIIASTKYQMAFAVEQPAALRGKDTAWLKVNQQV